MKILHVLFELKRDNCTWIPEKTKAVKFNIEKNRFVEFTLVATVIFHYNYNVDLKI